jgi:hypothetical protein
LHPSYPGGHAAVAGACATVMKAIFEETDVLAPAVTLSSDGSSLVDYFDVPITLGGEINKLAFNVPAGGFLLRGSMERQFRLSPEAGATLD